MTVTQEWIKVGETGRGTNWAGTERTNWLIVPAILRRRYDEWLSVRIDWQTGHEVFVVKPDGETAYVDGDQIRVLISTETSSLLGCINGHACVCAVETAPGQWSENRH